MLTLKCIWIEELPELLDTASYLTKILKLIFFFFLSALQISWSRFLDTNFNYMSRCIFFTSQVAQW